MAAIKYFKDTNDDTIKKIAEDISKSFINKGINDGTITDINTATACYVEFYNQATQSLLMQRENEKQKEFDTTRNLTFR